MEGPSEVDGPMAAAAPEADATPPTDTATTATCTCRRLGKATSDIVSVPGWVVDRAIKALLALKLSLFLSPCVAALPLLHHPFASSPSSGDPENHLERAHSFSRSSPFSCCPCFFQLCPSLSSCPASSWLEPTHLPTCLFTPTNHTQYLALISKTETQSLLSSRLPSCRSRRARRRLLLGQTIGSARPDPLILLSLPSGLPFPASYIVAVPWHASSLPIMASEPPSSRPEDSSPGSSTDQLTVNLQVVSPSVGVNRPLMFPGLAATTTVKQLKDKIRETLPLRPADENQRLIHRGRAITRETDTLLNIFGADALRIPDQQTMHLVIRDAHDSHASAPQVAVPQAVAPAPAPAAGVTAPVQPTNAARTHPHHHHHHFGPQPPPGFARRTQPAPAANPFPQPRMPSPSPAHTQEQAAAFQHHHQNMTQWLNQIQREAMARAVVQNQRARAQLGMRGIGDNAGNAVHTGGDNTGRASPAPSHTVYREHVGPNGQTYQVETVIRSTAPSTPNGSMSPADVQGILRGADSNQATLAMTSAMQRSASSTSLHNRSLAQPGVTAPVYPNSLSMGSGRGTPDSTGARPAGAGGNNTATRQDPEVYILSSPEGPRALLFNNSSSDTYYTPRLRGQTSIPQLRHSHPSALSNLIYESQGQIRSRQQQHHHHHHHHPRPLNQQPQPPQQRQQQQQQQPQPQPQVLQPQPQQQQQQNPPQPEQRPQDQANDQVQAQGDNQPPIAGLMHHGNPPVAALPPLLMQLWPQIWLVFRLALFVWFFTNPNASWSRWFTIICIAFFIFILSTGVLNGIPDHIWRPLGRHLENLIPMDPRAAQRAGQNQPNHAAGENIQPNPADMAARLVAQNQGPDGWLMAQIRRLERAGLLFLASIAPGVAERHIANLEAAAARADRERREAEAAAAQNNEDGENGENNGDGENGNNDAEQNNGEDAEAQPLLQPDEVAQDNNGDDMPAREQLIAV
ncbi:hypothetical protein AK830_g2993 [Neonectria ditissima]|uniref:Ubiquitin-like domain-containing protein n=1 Tax=Neonectria ditissima TaxID=78410 RepID=A0A0N8H846_9HYPO|nr:hypothetical protein AK830_g2993 [Neonectria ditissima]